MHSARSLLEQTTPVHGTDDRLREALHSLEQVEREQRFLAEAGEALASSLDYRETLNTVAHLAAGTISNFCVVEVIGDDGRFQPIASEDEDDVHCHELCATVEAARPQDVPGPILAALQSNQVVVIPQLPVDDDQPFFQALRAMGAASLIVAPMVARERALGVILLASRQGSRRYDEGDARMARELARRAAIAVDNARLYEQAQRALRARDEMLSVVAHDLRNPLGIIGMSAELISDGPDTLSTPIRTSLDRIRRSTDQMNRLIQDLLDVTKLEAGKLVLNRVPTNPSALLKEADYMLRPLAERASLTLTVEVESGLPAVLVDRGRFMQAVGNLIANSIKFSPAGASITIAAMKAPDRVAFSVTDTGKGIAAENLPHLFDRFWQERPADSRGLGLGLAIVQGIVNAHGGTISVRSEVDMGTSMTIMLPAVLS
jgi:signal transduction histidine kinase